MASRQLLQHLVALEDRPWREHRRGLPLTARGLAQLLCQLNIHPRRLDTDDGRLRAYPLDAFSDAFARYLPS